MNWIAIIFLLFTFLLFAGIMFTAFDHDFPYHKKATIKDSTCWGYGDFDCFMTEFNKIKWSISGEFEDCYCFRPDAPFFSDHDSYIHAGVIKFNGNGMVLKKRSEFRKFQRFLKENRNVSPSFDWSKKGKLIQMPRSNQNPSS